MPATSPTAAANVTTAPATVAATLTPPPANGEPNDRDEFVDTVGAQVEQIQKLVDDITDEVSNLSADEKASAQERLDDINGRIQDIQSKLDDAPSASDDEYATLKTEVEDTINTLLNDTQELADEVGI
jgi:gas vesicle protein